MTTMKTMTIAVLAAATWIGVSAICLSEIATVPSNLASISAKGGAHGPAPKPAPVAPATVAKAHGATPASDEAPHGG
jgi:hypothetical protein